MIAKPKPRRRKDGTIAWEVQYDQPPHPDGRRRRSTKTFDTEQDAFAYTIDRQRAKQMGAYAPRDPSRETLNSWLDEWLRQNEKTKARGTHELRRDLMDKWVRPFLGSTPLAELSFEVIQSWHDKIAAEPSLTAREAAAAKKATAKVANKTLAQLKTALTAARKARKIPYNPALDVERVREDAVDRRPFTVEEVEAVRYRLDSERDRALVSLLAYSGVRPEEALALTWRNVKQNTISVERAWTRGEMKTPKTRHSHRPVKMIPPVRDDLFAYKQSCHDPRADALVFGNESGRRPIDLKNWRARVWHKARDRAGVRYGVPYELRNTSADLILAETGDVMEVAANHGHASFTTSAGYLRNARAARMEGLYDAVEDITQQRSAAPLKARQRDSFLRIPPSGGGTLANEHFLIDPSG